MVAFKASRTNCGGGASEKPCPIFTGLYFLSSAVNSLLLKIRKKYYLNFHGIEIIFTYHTFDGIF